MASLVPDVHVAIVQKSDIWRSLAHWAADHSAMLTEHTNVVFSCGPSRTGDIEMKLNVGVHGPREFHVMLL
jgi:L-lactate dehydrogenase complex protein LldG